MGSPGADGMTCSIQMPDTERVQDIKSVESMLVFSQIEGQRNWEQVFRVAMIDRYSGRAGQLNEVVRMCIQAMKNGYLPVCVMDKYREANCFNARALLK